MHPELIYEDENIVVLNKPSGLVVHPFDFSEEETLLDFLVATAPTIFQIENLKLLQDKRIINTGGIVHKLDRETSGIMVVAKNENAFVTLQTLFKNHEVKKEYVAIVDGLVEKDSFVINAPLGRNRKDFKQTVNPEDLRGELRDAITGVEVLHRDKEKNITRVLLLPKTGRTHQLRAHMAYIGHPIIGDRIYGEVQTSSPRLLLHAKKLTFNLNGRQYEFETKTPEGF